MAERWTVSNKSMPRGYRGNKDRVGYSLKKQRVVSQSRRINKCSHMYIRKGSAVASTLHALDVRHSVPEAFLSYADA